MVDQQRFTPGVGLGHNHMTTGFGSGRQQIEVLVQAIGSNFDLSHLVTLPIDQATHQASFTGIFRISEQFPVRGQIGHRLQIRGSWLDSAGRIPLDHITGHIQALGR